MARSPMVPFSKPMTAIPPADMLIVQHGNSWRFRSFATGIAVKFDERYTDETFDEDTKL